MWIGFLAVIKKLSRDILASNQNQYQEVSLKTRRTCRRTVIWNSAEWRVALLHAKHDQLQTFFWLLASVPSISSASRRVICTTAWKCLDERSNGHFVRPLRFDFEEVEFFQRICQFLVGMCRTITEDLENRCPAGNPF